MISVPVHGAVRGLGTSKGPTGWNGRLQDLPWWFCILGHIPCRSLSFHVSYLPLWCLLILLDLFSNLGLFTTFWSPRSIS